MSEHDPWLVVLAGIICLLSALTAFRLYNRAHVTAGRVRGLWLALTGIATGSGIWATHFIAMLAYQPNVPSAWELDLTLASLAVAMGLTGSGFALALIGHRAAPILGGVIISLGVATMHYLGMSAFRVAGHVVWDADLVAASILFALVLSAAAVHVVHRNMVWTNRLAGAGLLTLSICVLHFVAMAAVTIVPDSTIVVPERALDTLTLAIVVASIVVVMLGGSFATAAADNRAEKMSGVRMRQLADAAVEGLVVCEGDRVIDANRSFLAMAGRDLADLVGRGFEADLVAEGDLILARAGRYSDMEIKRADGGTVPVEVVARPVVFGHRQCLVYAVRDLSERRRAESRIHFLAHHDSLTGLANRVTFNARLEDALARAGGSGQAVAVLCLDLDRFKEVNDVFGHQSGDSVLIETARRLADTVGEDDLVARLGGDEFAIVQYGGGQPERAGLLAERLIAAVEGEFSFAGQTTMIGVSIGIAVYPGDGTGAADLLANADTALYRAKTQGHSSFRYFEASMDEALRERRALAQDLRRAIAHDEFEVHYQPQATALSGDIVGFEALLRWRHRERGMVGPAEFIPIAEETGTIVALGEWVLRTVCREAAEWSNPLRVAVNLSPIQFQHGNLPDSVHRILLETGLTPSRLELEVTESVLIRDFQRAVDILRRLKALGVKIAMDDFGTGYSSLSNLQAFQFDKLKIDRSFVHDLDSQPKAAAIVRAVLGLGRSLSIPVVAEGVETRAQLDFLLGEDCDEVQGFILGRPSGIETFAHLVGAGEMVVAPPRRVAGDAA